MNAAHRPHLLRRHHGLTLLEVILSIAVLGGGLAVIGELVRVGVDHANESRQMATAQILCECKMEEVAAGVTAPTSASGPCESDSNWQYTINAGSADQTGLLQVQVTVEQAVPDRSTPLSFTLVRLILDPSLQAASTDQSSGTGTSAAGGTSTGGSSTSGAATSGTGSSSKAGGSNAR